MPRRPNQVPTETFLISTTPHVVSELETLVETGHFGKNVAEAAERIVATYLHQTFAGTSPLRQRPRRTSR